MAPDIISGEQVQEYEMGVIFGMYGDKRNAYRILVAKPQEKTNLWRLRQK
jgi:hypothetical protein